MKYTNQLFRSSISLILACSLVLSSATAGFAGADKNSSMDIDNKMQPKKTTNERENTEIIIVLKSEISGAQQNIEGLSKSQGIPADMKGQQSIMSMDGLSTERDMLSKKMEEIVGDVDRKLHLKKAHLRTDAFKNETGKKFKSEETDGMSELSNYTLLEIDKGDSIEAVVGELRKHKDVLIAQPNYRLQVTSAELPVAPEQSLILVESISLSTPSVTPEVSSTTPSEVLKVEKSTNLFDMQWGLFNTGQEVQGVSGTSGIDLNAVGAWETSKGDYATIIGVLDTGIDVSHRDLSKNIYTNTGEIPNNGIDDDGNGYIDDVNGWDFANKDRSVFDNADEDTHGTHVAGIIAAADDKDGITGVAPKVTLMPLKFMNGSTGYTSDAIEAIRYAESMGVRIVNCSFGSIELNPALEDAMRSSGMLFICSAGNNGQESRVVPVYPSNFQLGNIISVGAINSNGDLAGFSNYGDKVNLAAPGEEIISTIPGNKYAYRSGTSASAAYVSGAAALVASAKKAIGTKELRQLLLNQTSALNTLQGKVATGGMVDASKAIVAEVPVAIDIVNPAEIIVNILKEATSIAALNEKDLMLLADIFKVDPAALLTMDKYGYSIEDVTTLLVQFYNAKLSIEIGKELIEKINEPSLCKARLSAYQTEILLYNLKFRDAAQLVTYVGGKERMDLLRSTLIVSSALGIDLDEIIRKSDWNSSSESGLNDVSYYALMEKYYIDSNRIIEYQLESKLPWNEILKQIENFENSQKSSVSAMSSLFDKYNVYYGKSMDSPYKVGLSTNESIDPVAGSLKVSVPLFQIQGKTGTLPVGLEYHSDESETEKTRPQPVIAQSNDLTSVFNRYSFTSHWEYQPKDANGNLLEDLHFTRLEGPFETFQDAEHRRDQVSVESYPGWVRGIAGINQWINYENSPIITYAMRSSQIGYGWMLSLPSLERTPNEGIDYAKPEDTRYWAIHVDGTTIPFSQEWYQGKDRLSIDMTPFNQYQLELVDTTAFTNGEVNSHFVLKYLDGRKAYFGGDGRLLGIVDAFGNSTVFKHLVIGSEPTRAVVIREITDCYGNITNISYSSTGLDKTVTITQPDGARIVLVSQGGLLKSVTDQANRVTRFDDYDVKKTTAHFNLKCNITSDNTSKTSETGDIYDITYNLLKKITYPSGASTSFEYSEAKRTNKQTMAALDSKPYEGFFQVSRRYDTIAPGAAQSNGANFSYGDFSGYDASPNIGWSSSGWQHFDNLSMSYQHESVISYDNGQNRKFKFNYKHLPISEIITGGDRTIDITREFDKQNNITKQVEKVVQSGVSSPLKETHSTYNGFNQLTQQTDELGNVTSITYQAENQNLPASETIPVESGKTKIVTYTLSADRRYNQFSQVTATNANGSTETIKSETQLNADGSVLLERVFKNNLLQSQLDYVYANKTLDAKNRVVNRITLSSINTIQDINATGNPLQTQSPVSESYDFDSRNGLLLTLKNPLGKTEAYEYDPLGRLTKLIGFDGSFKTIDYNDAMNEVTATDEAGVIVKKTYDSLGRELEVYGGTAASPERLSEKAYDTNGWLISQKDGNGNKTTFKNNSFGQMVESVNPDGSTRKVCYLPEYQKTEFFNEEGHKTTEYYDLKGNVVRVESTDGGGQSIVIQKAYTADGQVKTLRDANGYVTTNMYDELGRLIQVVNAKGETSKYFYDVKGNLISQIYPNGQTATKTYSQMGQLLSETDMAGKTQYMAYALDGTRTKLRDRNNNLHSFGYDTKLRLNQQTGSDYSIAYSYLANDRVSSVTDSTAGTIGYSYFPNGKLRCKTFADGKSIEYSYDRNGNVTSVKDPYGLVTTYGYSERNQLSTISAMGKTFTYGRYADGMPQTLTYPSASIQTRYSFDNLNRLTYCENKVGDTNLASDAISYDPNCNIIGKTTTSDTKGYKYDQLNRLTQVDMSGANLHTSLQYDQLGNRSSASGYVENFVPKITSLLTWDSRDRLKTITASGKTATYVYNYNGIRCKKVSAAGTTNYYADEAGRVVAETESADASKAQIIWSDRPLVRIVNDVWYYYVYNSHGDVVYLVNEAGATVNSYKYDEWGNLTAKTEAIANPIRYAGEYQDDESGFYYLRARYYEPVTGRFISRDTNEGKITNPLSLNLYTYCWNNPLNLVDPTGNDPEDLRERDAYVDPGMTISLIDATPVLGWTVTFAEMRGAELPRNAAIDTIATAVSVKQLGKSALKSGIKNGAVQGIVKDGIKSASNIEKGLNFAKTPAAHMENPGRFVPVQTLQDVIKSTKGVADPKGSSALMHYTTITINKKMYNIEVLYDEAKNMVYHFEYTRKAIGNLPAITK